MRKKRSKRLVLGPPSPRTWIVGGVLVLGVSLMYAPLIFQRPAQDTPQSYAVPPFHTAAEAAKPLPPTLLPSLFKQQPEVERAYQAAQEIPEVLAQMPCYCHCDRIGHRSLHQCYTTDHAASCQICITEALLAQKLHKAGRSDEEIRHAIIRGDWRGL